MKNSEKIIAEYVKYLDEHSTEYDNRQGLYVKIGLKNSDHTFIHLVPPLGREREFCLFDYVGNCDTGVRIAKRVARELQKSHPDYTIWAEKFTSFEIDIEHAFEFTTVGDLHQRVLRMASVIDDCIPIGRAIAGDAFYR